jgi:hypothetical protein
MQNANSITRRQFWGTLLACAAVLVCANAIVGRLTQSTVSRRILADANNAGSAVTIALGNSLVRSGFNAGEFVPSASGRPVALNMAMGAASPAEHLLLLRAALRVDGQAKLLLYGFYDFQLTDPVTFSFGDLIGNHDLLYYDEPEFARRYYAMSERDVVAFEISRRASLLSERGAIWAKVERLRRVLAQQGMPVVASNQFGRVADFTLLEASSQEEFVKHCEQASEAHLNAPVQEIIRETQGRHMRVVFVLMPLPPQHVRAFYETPAWGAYQGHIEGLLAMQNVGFIDASHWFPEGGRFGDALHLNDEGARLFSRRLGAMCGDLNQLDACGK